MFTDKIRVRLIAGKGGNGVVAWRRERYISKGGPTGGNGSPGGSVILKADHSIHSLDFYRNRRLLKAEKGREGGRNLRQGRKGKPLIVKVPCGTLVKDAETGEILHDLTTSGQTIEICQGGRGGRGNASFKLPTRQAPNFCTPGQPGEERAVELELKLIADVGLVGFPNAGKSTLIQALTNVRVKTAPYPFTTLRPNLGHLKFDDESFLLIADIPGIIAGAHQNRGLGFEFLRHIERTTTLIFILDASGIDGRDPTDDYSTLQSELEAYDPVLLTRPSLVLLNKCDTPESKEHITTFRKAYPDLNPFEISALTGHGLDGIHSILKNQVVSDICSRV